MKKLSHILTTLTLCTLSFSTFAKPATEASVEKALLLGDIKGTLAQSQKEMHPVYEQQAEEMLKKIWIQPSCPLMTQQSVTYWIKKSISMN